MKPLLIITLLLVSGCAPTTRIDIKDCKPVYIGSDLFIDFNGQPVIHCFELVFRSKKVHEKGMYAEIDLKKGTAKIQSNAITRSESALEKVGIDAVNKLLTKELEK